MTETMSISDTLNGDNHHGGGGEGHHVSPGDRGDEVLPHPLGWNNDLRGPPILESLLLSVSSFWFLRETKERVVELLERHFRQDEMLHALQQLSGMVVDPLPLKRQQS